MKHLMAISIFLFIFSNAQAQETVPNFTVTDIYGQEHSLYEDYLSKGKYVLIDFFSSGCVVCQEIAPILNEAYLEYGCNCGEVVFLAIDGWSYDNIIWDFSFAHSLEFPAVSGNDGDGDKPINEFGIIFTPYKILISPDGHILMDNDVEINQASDLTAVFESYNIENAVCSDNEFLFYSLISEQDSAVGQINSRDKTVQVQMSAHSEEQDLRAYYRASGRSSLTVNGIEQINGLSTNDFSSGSIEYLITAENGESETWTVYLQTPTNSQRLSFNNAKLQYRSGHYFLQNNTGFNEAVSYEILNSTGQSVAFGQIAVGSRKHKLETSGLGSGFYILYLKMPNGEQKSFKIIL